MSDDEKPANVRLANSALEKVADVAEAIAREGDLEGEDGQTLLSIASRYKKAAGLVPDLPLTVSEAVNGLDRLTKLMPADKDSQRRGRLYGAVVGRTKARLVDDGAYAARCAGAWMQVAALLAHAGMLRDAETFRTEAELLYQQAASKWKATGTVAPQPAGLPA